jgi:hypothetical protein
MTKEMSMRLGREQLPWSQDVWHQLQQAIDDQCRAVKVGAKCIPLGSANPAVTTLPQSQVVPMPGQGEPNIAEAQEIPVVEIYFDFSLTEQQVQREAELGAARTLAINGARVISLEEDRLIFNPRGTTPPIGVQNRNFRLGQWRDLLGSASFSFGVQNIGRPFQWGQAPVIQVAFAIEAMRQVGQSGPYALALSSIPYADVFRLIPLTSTSAQQLITPLVREQLFSAWSLPIEPLPIGILLSVDSSCLELTYTINPTLQLLRVTEAGLFQFRVFERFTFRVKNPLAIAKLIFQ